MNEPDTTPSGPAAPMRRALNGAARRLHNPLRFGPSMARRRDRCCAIAKAAVDGVATRHREWRDTTIVNPNGKVDIAFVGDNPGDWMFHCHILQHQAAGMMGSIRVLG